MFLFLDVCVDPDFPSEEQLDNIYENPTNYRFLVDHMLPCVVGRPTWKVKRTTSLLSTFVTPSDEAFMMVGLKNSMNRWYTRHRNGFLKEGEKKTPLPPQMYTRGPVKTWTKKHPLPIRSPGKGGWNVQGRLEFIRFHELAVKHRQTKDFKNFETEYLAEFSKLNKRSLPLGMNMPPMPMDFEK